MFRPVFRRYGLRTPFQEVDRLQREMNRLLNEFGPTSSRSHAPDYPAINIWTNSEGVVVTAELPGMDPDDINISVVGETLTLSGSRRLPENLGEEVTFHRRERGYGSFSRSFQLPFMVEADKVEAVFEKGILQISAPRAEADKPRKITVKTA